MDAHCVRQYADASVQTSPISVATRVHHLSTTKTTPIPIKPKRVTYVDETTPGNCPDSAERRVYPRTPINRMKTQLPFNLPSKPLSPSLAAQTQRRIISLPGHRGADTLSERLSNSLVACSRSVSMPAVIQHFPQVEMKHEESPARISPSISYEEDYSFSQDFSSTRVPLRTPSVPSTPDSIEIIDSSFHFSEAFLRDQGQPKNNLKLVHKDWLTWSNSPPRPIPALHGPASLPYARCPSGAEGTIIEEPSTVPGLIWGLKDSNSSVPKEHTQPSNDRANIITSAHRVHPGASHDGHQPSAPCIRNDGHRTHDRTSAPLLPTGTGVEVEFEDHSEHCKIPSVGFVNGHDYLTSGQRDLGQQCEHVHSTIRQSLAPGQSVDTHLAMDLPDRHAILGSYNDADRYLYDLGSPHPLVHPQNIQTSEELLRAILRERSGNNGNVNLAYQAATFPMSGRLDIVEQSEVVSSRDNAVKSSVPAPRTIFGASPEMTCGLHVERSIPQHTLPTPPNSTSPHWCAGPSPLLGNALDDLGKTYYTTVHRKPASQQYGLNLRAPAESLDELSDQLRRLILQQQVSEEAIMALNHNRISAERPEHEQQVSNPTSFPATLNQPASSKPTMPINLQDLVTRHMSNQTHPVVILNPAASPVIPTSQKNNSFPTVWHGPHSVEVDTATPKPPLIPQDEPEDRAGRGDVLTGKRHPRSIPLSRLIDRKLAPVPEETSFTNSNTEAPSSPKSPTFTSVAVSERVGKQDYDFAELRSPVLGSVKDSPVDPRPSPVRPFAKFGGDELAKQEKRQVRISLPPETTRRRKAIPSKPKGRKMPPNDENIHRPDTSATTPRKKIRINYRKNRDGESAKKVRRKE